jgi:1-acyl-sn-glycerol-3-phosphate acyltransferase
MADRPARPRPDGAAREDLALRGALKPSRLLGWARALGIVGWTLWVTALNLRTALSGKGMPPSVTMKWHRGVRALSGTEVVVTGKPILDRPVLMLSNHVSYLDIVVLASILPCSFVAKAEVASWPGFGWLAKQQRTIFVERDPRRAKGQLEEMKARLQDGACLVLFPEGTSSDGSRVLPFKSSLLQAAEIELAGAGTVEVQTVSIAYTRLDGMPMGRALRPFYAWYGDMELAPHLIDLLGLGSVSVDLVFHEPTRLSHVGDRKSLARLARSACAGGVESALKGPPVALPLLPPPGPEVPCGASRIEVNSITT